MFGEKKKMYKLNRTFFSQEAQKEKEENLVDEDDFLFVFCSL